MINEAQSWTLVNPSEKSFLLNAGDRPNLGLLYVKKALSSAGVDSEIVDLNHTSRQEFIRYLVRQQPRIVGISCLSHNFNEVQGIISDVRLYVPYAKVVVGGYHPTQMPESFKKVADHVVQGYAEGSLFGKEFDINLFPIPDRTGIVPEKYGMLLTGLPATIMIASRGCPYNCAFCGNWDKQTKYRRLDNVVEELEIIKGQGYKAVYFVDDNFTMNEEWATDIGEQSRRLGLKYRIETRANFVNERMARMLGMTGCVTVGMGIESGSDSVLRKVTKGTNTEMIRNAVRTLNEHGVKTKGFFIFGLPGETLRDARLTIDYAMMLKKQGLEWADFYVLCPFPTSPVWRKPASFGIRITDPDFTKYLAAGKTKPECFVDNGFLSPEMVCELRDEAEKAFREA